jgi:hypothetical protein
MKGLARNVPLSCLFCIFYGDKPCEFDMRVSKLI